MEDYDGPSFTHHGVNTYSWLLQSFHVPPADIFGLFFQVNALEIKKKYCIGVPTWNLLLYLKGVNFFEFVSGGWNVIFDGPKPGQCLPLLMFGEFAPWTQQHLFFSGSSLTEDKS